MTMHDPAAIWVEANIRETEIGRLAAGQRATVHVDAYPGEVFEGRIDRIGHAANSQFALLPRLNASGRSEERPVGKECVRKCRSRRTPDHKKNYKKNTPHNLPR